jgi:hypothetical protein
MTWVSDEITLIKAWGILTLVDILGVLLQPQSALVPEHYHYVGMVISAIAIGASLLSVRYIRGKSVRSRKPPYYETELGVWGYIWRSQIVYYSAVVSGGIAGKVLVGDYYDSSTALWYGLFGLFFISFIPIVTWSLFSSNRIDQLRKAFAYLNGC